MNTSLSNRDWVAFLNDKEGNSRHAADDWARYVRGVRRIRTTHVRVRATDRDFALARDVFFCATHWRKKPRIVRSALRKLFVFKLDVSTAVFAAAEYLAWARKVDLSSVEHAESLLRDAEQRIPDADELTQANLRKMLSQVVRRGREPL